MGDHPPSRPGLRQAEASGLTSHQGKDFVRGCLLSYALEFEPGTNKPAPGLLLRADEIDDNIVGNDSLPRKEANMESFSHEIMW